MEIILQTTSVSDFSNLLVAQLNGELKNIGISIIFTGFIRYGSRNNIPNVPFPHPPKMEEEGLSALKSILCVYLYSMYTLLESVTNNPFADYVYTQNKVRK